MKIGILTHRLYTNYGGILQNFALQTILKRMGHDVETLDYTASTSIKIKVLSFVKRLLLKMTGKNVPLRGWPTKDEDRVITQNTSQFVKKHISTSEKFPITGIATYAKYHQYDAIVVGSDQVWRGAMIQDIGEFFLKSFGKKTKKVAYAASFGVDNWEFNSKQTSECRKLAKEFAKISVREDSGVTLCDNYLNVNAQHVLDPTMLLNKDDYQKLLNLNSARAKRSCIMVYVLDKSPQKKEIIDWVKKETGLTTLEVMAESSFKEVGKAHLSRCVFPPIEEWICGFRDCDLVVTDSFHGTVFSIIFNKPFISIANSQRGLSRFTSLLKMFNLEDRLISDKSQLTKQMFRPFDYTDVNRIMKEKQVEAYDFLTSALN